MLIENRTSNNQLSQIIKTASVFTRKYAFKLWTISHLMLPQKRREYALLCFYYLKWIDDFVDNPENQQKTKKEFIDKQFRLIEAFKKNEQAGFSGNEELIIYYLIRYAGTINNYSIIDEIKKSLQSIRMDVERLSCKGVFSSNELKLYSQLTVQPVFNLAYYFLIPSEKNPITRKCLGYFIYYVLLQRDFFEDIEMGYINISEEEIEKYNLDTKGLKEDPNLSLWMRDKYSEYLEILGKEIVLFKSMPLRIKLFWAPIYPYMIYELMKFKTYGFVFGEKKKININKEIKTSMSAIFLITRRL
jgi:hypothetical protein